MGPASDEHSGELGCQGLACAPDNCLWIRTIAQLQLRDSNGRFVRALSKRYSKRLACDSNGEIWIATYSGGQLLVCDASGGSLRKFKKDWAYDVAVDGNGLVFVSCGRGSNVRIEVLHRDGSAVRTIDGSGRPDGKFCGEITVAVNAKRELYVTGTSMARVQVLPPLACELFDELLCL